MNWGERELDWRSAITTLVLALVVVVGFYQGSIESMVSIWWRSETFAHGFLILPISLFLIWRMRDELACLTPVFTPLAVVPLIGFGAAWLLASFVDVLVVEQLAFVGMLVTVVLGVLGWQLFWKLFFPLMFLFFAVPMGEGLIPPLMEVTADFTIMMLQLTGIPVYREGMYFEIPSGNWSVVEGCSGVRYLIASVTLGCLYAYMAYRTAWKRILFVLVAIAVPIVANGLRAYMIVMIAHLSDMTMALGVDHLIYGWVFFGFVIMLLFWVGSYWREDEEPLEGGAQLTGRLSRAVTATPRRMITMALILGASAAFWPAFAIIQTQGEYSLEASLKAPQIPGWHQSNTAMTEWQPRYQGLDSQLTQSYHQGDARFSLIMGVYADQDQNAELISSQNVLVVQKHPEWRQVGLWQQDVNLAEQRVAVQVGKLRANSGQNLLVFYWYRIGDVYTSSRYLAKALEAKARFLGQPGSGSVIMVATEFSDTPDDELKRLEVFASDALAAVAQELDRVVDEIH